MFNSVYKRCNSNDANAWCDTGAGELHATFFDSPSDGSHALPPTAQVVAQVVAPPMEQSVAYQRPSMVGTVGAGELHSLTPSAGGVWVFRTVCFERVVLSSPGCLWPGRMDDHEEVLEAHA